MRATLLVAPRQMEIGEVPDPEPGPRDVLLRVQAVGLCGTDFHIYSGHANYNCDEHDRPIPLAEQPQTLGHEFTGVVAEVGREVRDFRPGDRVAVDQGYNCRSLGIDPVCEYCRTGDTHQCENYREPGITGLRVGLAEAIAVPAINTQRIESDLDPAHAAMVEPLGCVLHSTETLWRADARYRLGETDPRRRARTVLVCGAGPAGYLHAIVLRDVLGYDGRVIVSDPLPDKRALVESLGFETLDAGAPDLKARLSDATDGRMAEVVIDASGAGALFHDLPRLMRKQSTVVLYGHGHGGVGMELLNAVQFREPTLLSPVGASGGFDPDGRPTIYRRALELLEAGEIPLEPIVSHRIESLDAVPEAFSTTTAEADYLKGVALFS